MRDFNDAQRVFANGSLSGFTETSPFVGITDAGLVPGGGTGPIGWETYQPETQLWLYKYYGDTETMRESFNSTYAYIQLLDSNPSGIGHGLGDWMPVVGTSTEFTGPGFLRMSCEYRLSLSLSLSLSSLCMFLSTWASWVVTLRAIVALLTSLVFCRVSYAPRRFCCRPRICQHHGHPRQH